MCAISLTRLPLTASGFSYSVACNLMLINTGPVIGTTPVSDLSSCVAICRDDGYCVQYNLSPDGICTRYSASDNPSYTNELCGIGGVWAGYC